MWFITDGNATIDTIKRCLKNGHDMTVKAILISISFSWFLWKSTCHFYQHGCQSVTVFLGFLTLVVPPGPDLHILHLSELSESILQIFLGDRVAQPADVQPPHRSVSTVTLSLYRQQAPGSAIQLPIHSSTLISRFQGDYLLLYSRTVFILHLEITILFV